MDKNYKIKLLGSGFQHCCEAKITQLISQTHINRQTLTVIFHILQSLTIQLIRPYALIPKEQMLTSDANQEFLSAVTAQLSRALFNTPGNWPCGSFLC